MSHRGERKRKPCTLPSSGYTSYYNAAHIAAIADYRTAVFVDAQRKIEPATNKRGRQHN
ncbi:MAG: hypothetical protein QJR12_01155 [Mycobacterium sp.]|uniref:hypothetical protein n=1 Tax=Mycobacterium sp. TaxID=1785 RepID=UPI00260E40D7|nr:hypothetical protein [Mycobacterium sp.]MDI3312928.1 hypothetical protein [Mycobacterium sp.]